MSKPLPGSMIFGNKPYVYNPVTMGYDPAPKDAKAPESVSLLTSKPRMNQTETELYAMLCQRGYEKVRFEAITLEIGDGAKFTPDFYCLRGDLIRFYECKNNFIRTASLVRLKVAARAYPEFVFVLAQKKRGVWKEKRIQP